jgi:maltose alpha-D-glucosyltransferase/alpha-amylase
VIKDLWYKNAIIYSLTVGTFMDSNGDGVGDFVGLIRRLDYLAGLGITCLWLGPFQTSPRRDDGYDITDYFSVDPRFGNLGDFVDFTYACKQRGIRVIIDLVVNHTSDKHPWFQAAKRDKLSKFRDYYVWSKKKPKDAHTGMVFPGVQKSTWTYDADAREYYFHRFYKFQPDLNTANPDVQTEIRKVMGFWLQLGVDGFRMDALPFVIGKKSGSGPETQQYPMLRDFREFLQWRRGDSMILAEANVLPKTNMHYFGDDGDRMHMMFNFHVNQAVFLALACADTRPLTRALNATRKRPATAQWAHFLRNHDELDLGRLTPTQRAKVFKAFGPDKDMQLYDRGIRRRLAPMLNGDRRRLELAYSLLFSLPGTPVIRYGDELGMGDDLRLEERNAARTPMQWTDEPNAGFSRAPKLALPVIDRGAYGYDRVNAAAQRHDTQSLLNWTERMIRMRKEVPELGWGDFSVVDTGDRGVLALRYTWRDNDVLAIHNFRDSAIEIRVQLGGEAGKKLVSLFTHDTQESKTGRHEIVLEPYGYVWYRMGGLGYALDRHED